LVFNLIESSLINEEFDEYTWYQLQQKKVGEYRPSGPSRAQGRGVPRRKDQVCQENRRGEFGGLSAEVLPMSRVMCAAFDIALVETVGVGQREIDVSALCDTTCFVAQPGSGDSIQFLKAGILEVPHVLVVNKEDMGAVARQTLSELAAALGREHPDGGWQVPVLSVSATRCRGIDALAEALASHCRHRLETGSLQAHRRQYQASWVIRRLQDEFGQQGLRRLGGEASLQAEMAAGTASALQDYEKYRSQIVLNQ
jgi:LAO/AO transport system kinase